MQLKPVIDRLKAEAATLGGRIAGTAEFTAELEAASMANPCAFVAPGPAFARGDPDTIGEVVQMVVEEFGIFVAIDNSTDGVGYAARLEWHDVKADIMQALLGWTPPPIVGQEQNAFIYLQDEPFKMDRARLWMLITFSTEGPISSLG